MITSDQIRAARALLRWSAKDLAEKASLSLPTIQRMEAAEGIPTGLSKNLVHVQEALENAGVMFIVRNEQGGVGVRLKD